jgi:MFS family permease
VNVSHRHEARRPLVPDTVAFWGLGGLLAWLMFAASAPSPLYRIYAARWHFSPLTLTVIFALYAVALLAALLVTGRLSDHLGRRPVIIGALAVVAVATVCFIMADGTATLALARVLQGLGTGGAIGAIGGAQSELADGVSPGLAPVVSSASPTFGLAAGAPVSSALVQYAPAPMRLVYWVVLAGLILGFLLVAGMRETGERRPGAAASLVPHAAVSARARPAFVRALASIIAIWALSGFYLALVPSLTLRIVGSGNSLWGGAVLFSLYFAGGVSVIVRRKSEPRPAMLAGCGSLVAGAGLCVAAIAAGSTALLIAGSIIGGVGFGLAFLGSFRAVSSVAAPSERAGTIAVMYTVSYLAFSVPVVIAGLAELHYSERGVSLAFSAAVAVLGAVGVVTALAPLHLPHHHQASAALPPCPGTVPPYIAAAEPSPMPARDPVTP